MISKTIFLSPWDFTRTIRLRQVQNVKRNFLPCVDSPKCKECKEVLTNCVRLLTSWGGPFEIRASLLMIQEGTVMWGSANC